MPWLCKTISWSWTFPWVLVVFKAIDVWPSDSGNLLHRAANIMSAIVSIGGYIIAALIVSAALRYWHKSREENGHCCCYY